jgi:hypothetical protein
MEAPKVTDKPASPPPPTVSSPEGGALPTTWREAVPYVVWVVLVLGFGLELVAAFVRGEWVHFGVSLAGLVALMGHLVGKSAKPELGCWGFGCVIADPGLFSLR